MYILRTNVSILVIFSIANVAFANLFLCPALCGGLCPALRGDSNEDITSLKSASKIFATRYDLLRS